MSTSRLTLAAACVACMLAPATARAEASASEILKIYDSASQSERAIIESNLSGVENGFGWANTWLTGERRQTALYCLPSKLALDADMIIDILRRGVRSDSRVGAAPFGLAMLVLLQREYPCR